MSKYSFAAIAEILDAKILKSYKPDEIISTLGFDSRTLVSPRTCLFFAIKSKNSDGHKYLADSFEKGVRNFVVEEADAEKAFPKNAEVNILRVNNSVEALQKLAA